MAVTIDKNVDYDRHNITIVKGDTLYITYGVELNDVAYDMSGMQLDMKIKDSSGTTILTLSSAGTSPAITISTTSFTIDSTGFTTVGWYSYDLQLTTSGKEYTIAKGRFRSETEITD